jgi:fatty aldehyde-generating acyl-ACP reductase
MKKIGFLVHPRTTADVIRKYPVFRFLPKWLFNRITYMMPPIKVSKITGLVDTTGQPVQGYVLGIIMSPEQMTENRAQALKKIIQATQKAKNMGVGILGLGAMTASFSKGGLDVIEKIPGTLLRPLQIM